MTLPLTAGPWQVRPAEPTGTDVDLITRWMSAPHVEEFWHQAWDTARWSEEIAGQRTGAHSLPCLALYEGEPLAYLELYRVVLDRLAPCYPSLPDDLGVHIAIGDVAETGRGLGRSLLRTVADGMLVAEPGSRRVVAEPDARNTESLRAFSAAGFEHCGEIALPEKTAALMVRPRSREDLPR